MITGKTLLIICLFFMCGCNHKIEPNETYKLNTIIDSSGNTYSNLRPRFINNTNEFVDIHGKIYVFHGNYTVISSTISGYDLIKLTREKE